MLPCWRRGYSRSTARAGVPLLAGSAGDTNLVRDGGTRWLIADKPFSADNDPSGVRTGRGNTEERPAVRDCPPLPTPPTLRPRAPCPKRTGDAEGTRCRQPLVARPTTTRGTLCEEDSIALPGPRSGPLVWDCNSSDAAALSRSWTRKLAGATLYTALESLSCPTDVCWPSTGAAGAQRSSWSRAVQHINTFNRESRHGTWKRTTSQPHLRLSCSRHGDAEDCHHALSTGRAPECVLRQA